MSQKLTRKELYDLVWSQPMTKLGERFGISDVALAKHCQKMQVPIPARGYWARKAAGKPIIKMELPPRPLGFDDDTVIGGGRYARYYHSLSTEEILGPIPPKPTFEDSIEAVLSGVEDQIKKVVVPKGLDRPHSTVAKLLSLDDARREKQRGMSYISTYDSPRYDSPIQRRRLRILSAIFMATASCGCRMETVRSEPYGQPLDDFVIIVGHQSVSLRASVVEVRRRSGKGADLKVIVENNLKFALDPGTDRQADGRFWEDGDLLLEQQARDIAVAIVVKGEQQHRANALHSYQWRIKQKEDLIERMHKEKEEGKRPLSRV